MDQGKAHPGDILILEIGSSGGWNDNYQTLIPQYNAMIAHSGCANYIIVGDTDDPQNSVDESVAQAAMAREESGDSIGTGDTSWDAALRQEYGEHFINMRAFMIEIRLGVAGLTPTEANLETAKDGAISVSCVRIVRISIPMGTTHRP